MRDGRGRIPPATHQKQFARRKINSKPFGRTAVCPYRSWTAVCGHVRSPGAGTPGLNLGKPPAGALYGHI